LLGIVLAAGAGRRLRPHTDALPKALVPVAHETTILDVVLSNFAAVDLREVVVVIGHAAEAVRDRTADLERRHGLKLTLVYNDKAEEWNNAYSLWCARDHLYQGALLVNGDTVHPDSVEKTLLSAPATAPIVLAVDNAKTLADEEMKVTVSPEGYVRSITKSMNPAEAYGEYIGVTLIRPDAAERLADALRATFERDPQLYYEDGYAEMVARGERIAAAPIGDIDWVEVDNQDDLVKARQVVRRYLSDDPPGP
jgi:choline kinase